MINNDDKDNKIKIKYVCLMGHPLNRHILFFTLFRSFKKINLFIFLFSTTITLKNGKM